MTGTELYADIEHACSLYENWIDVEVDGAVTQHFMLPVGRNRVCIFRGMERDEMKHVRIIRDAVETYASETKDVHMRYLSLTDTAPDEMGSREHPGLVAHARAAREIVSVLRERIPG